MAKESSALSAIGLKGRVMVISGLVVMPEAVLIISLLAWERSWMWFHSGDGGRAITVARVWVTIAITNSRAVRRLNRLRCFVSFIVCLLAVRGIMICLIWESLKSKASSSRP